MKKVACIEARYNSSRLPGKMFKPIFGKPLLQRVIERVAKSKLIDEIIIATSTNKCDERIIDLAKEMKIKVYRGSENNVLERVIFANTKNKSDLIIEICGDCPLIDFKLIDIGINEYFKKNCDIVNCGYVGSYPQGLDFLILKRELLANSYKFCNDSVYREHVGLFFLENQSDFKINFLKPPKKLNFPDLRFQVDYIEDLRFVRNIYEGLIPSFGEDFTTNEIIDYLMVNKDLLRINNKCLEKPVR